MRILILGGTTEARELAGRLAGRTDVTVTLSLAGRTAAPARQPVPVRIGGFGGADGLIRHLADHRVDILIDATHPYAANMSANAATAARAAGVKLLALRRPGWAPIAGDRWIDAKDPQDAVQAIGAAPARVFLALGRKDIAPFEQAPQHFYLVRSVDPVVPPLAVPRVRYITARGPFDADADRRMLELHDIGIIVAKNSGGSATYSKIAAARMLEIPVVMLRRPVLPGAETAETVDAAVMWLDHRIGLATARGV
jgi:precorrin-6A/cobalt-precorrin-6A reductase